MHRQQFDCGDAEILQVLDRHRVRETCIRAAQFLRYLCVRAAESFDVGFVDDGAVPRRVRRTIVSPVEERIDDDALGNERRAIEVVLRVLGIGEVIRKDRFAPVPQALNRFRVRIEEYFRWIEPLTVVWRPGAVDAKTITLPRT